MKEIWHQICSLVPMRDAARAACVSHVFLKSWECHPNLIVTKETICPNQNLRKWTGTQMMKDIEESITTSFTIRRGFATMVATYAYSP
jgi:hypothetical protein